MMDSELKKTSVRANTLEKKRYEMLLSSFDSAKRSVAVDMKKSQLYFKQRLKRYKDRQREILSTRGGPSSASMEEFVLRQLRRRTQLNLASAQTPSRPQTWSHTQQSLPCPRDLSARPAGAFRARSAVPVGREESPQSDHAHGAESSLQAGNDAEFSGKGSCCNSAKYRGSAASRSAINVAETDGNTTSRSEYLTKYEGVSSETCFASRDVPNNTAVTSSSSNAYEEDADFAKLSHCRRSKVDLRPCTAWSVVRPSMTAQPTCHTNISDCQPSPYSKTASSSSSKLRLLQLRDGAMGTPARQTRYLDDEEIEERCTFYRFLLHGLQQLERCSLELLKDRVDDFCGRPLPAATSTTVFAAAAGGGSADDSGPSTLGQQDPQPAPVGRSSRTVSAAAVPRVGHHLPLPPGIPLIIHQALKVGVTPPSAPQSEAQVVGSAYSLKLRRAKTR